MKLHRALLVLSLGYASTLSAAPLTAEEVTVRRLQVQVPSTFAVKSDAMSAEVKAAFPGGFPQSLGSGLALKVAKAGKLQFWVLNDRGPNGDSPLWQEGAQRMSSKVFPVPDFTPAFGVVEVGEEGARLLEMQPLRDAQGKALSGRPLPPGSVGSSLEMPLTDRLQALSYDAQGVDPEGIVDAGDGTLWLCDEYGPFLLQVEAKTGRVLQRLAPGSGLPDILRYRRPNRGFEGVAFDHGKVYGLVQSTLDIEGKTEDATFVRLVEYDARSKQTRNFAVPIEPVYKKNRDAKMGDLLALGHGRFLMVEQGKGADGVMRNSVFLLDLNGASDLQQRTVEGKPLESINSRQGLLSQGIQLVRKEKLLEMRDLGWMEEKLEGITLLPDRQTLAVANDNDFGLKASLGKQKDWEKVVADSSGQVKDLSGKVLEERYKIEAQAASDSRSRLWLVKLPKKVDQYFGF